MDLDGGSIPRSFNGCWTCRLRRKKCDEKHPICDVCAALHITCHYDPDKPEWMDGGVRQGEMAERIKREVKTTAHRRRDRVLVAPVEVATGETMLRPQRQPADTTPGPSSCHVLTGLETTDRMDGRGTSCAISSTNACKGTSLGRPDYILVTFYLEHLLPFLFPFYHPPVLQGGKAWILEMMMKCPVVRQATLCQSSHFFSLARGTTNVCGQVAWETVLKQAEDAFGVLSQALQVIDGPRLGEHLHGATRILASIMQLQRFEISVLSFENCRAHLNAALTLFTQLLDTVEPAGTCPRLRFNAFMSRLGPSSWLLPSDGAQVPSAEQAAFCFSSALLIFDDIIASTVIQEPPKLYGYHHTLLGNVDGDQPIIDLETVVGCENWVLLQIGEIAVLDAWKQRCKNSGSLDVMELVHRAAAIKGSLEAHLTELGTDAATSGKETNVLLDVLAAEHGQQSDTRANQTSLVNQAWVHAAFLYLSVVVSGWQPANPDVRYHVGRIIELLTLQISPPALLRTMVWPFCVAGCLAEPAHDACFRRMAEALQPPSIFGTIRRALEIMEAVWSDRDRSDSFSRDLALCFRTQGDLVLLV